MIHTVSKQSCPQCNAMMVTQIWPDKIAYVCINKHEPHPPLRFRDSSNGE